MIDKHYILLLIFMIFYIVINSRVTTIQNKQNLVILKGNIITNLCLINTLINFNFYIYFIVY